MHTGTLGPDEDDADARSIAAVRSGCHLVLVAESTEQLDLTITLGAASFAGTGPAEQVMAALERFSDLIASADIDVLDEPPAGEAQGEPAADVEPAPPGEKEVLPVFLKGRTLKGNIETAAAIVAWAQKHDGKADGIKPADVATYWRGTNIKEPGNLRRDLRSAVKAGLLHSSNGQYTVTGFGKKTIGLDDA